MMSRNGNERTEMPDPEVVPVAQRRRFSAGEKLRILEEAEACTEPGEFGALLRREGIYSSYVSRWRQARDRGQLTALGEQQRGPKPATEAALTREVARLRRENERLQARLDQAEAIIEVQKNSRNYLGRVPRGTRATRSDDRSGGRAGRKGGRVERMSGPGSPAKQFVPCSEAQACFCSATGAATGHECGGEGRGAGRAQQ
jgi:transposase